MECEGYLRDRIFVTGKIEVATSSGKLAVDAKAEGETKEPSVTAVTRAAQTHKPWDIRYSRAFANDVDIVTPDSLVQVAREQLYIGLFCTSSLPFGRPYSKRAAELSSNGWPWFISSLYNSDETLKHAAVSISTAIVGAEKKDEQLRLKGLQSYNRSLSELGKSLRQPNQLWSDSTLATTRIMQLYEV